MYAPPPRPASRPSSGSLRWPGRLVLFLLALASLGFEWQGRVDHLAEELRVAEAGRRRDIVRLLAGYPSPRARTAILGALADPDAEVRSEAAEACGRLQLTEAIPELSEWLLDPLGETRASAAHALGAMNDTASLPALIRTLGDTAADVRIAAIDALASIGGAEVITPLLGRLDDDDVTVRIAAATALGGLRDERAVVPLIGRARDDSAEVRVAVFAALGSLGDVRALSALALGTRDTVEEARLTATLALGQLRSPRAIDSLRGLLEQPDARLRAAALDALAPIPDPRASQVILDALGSIPGAQTIAMEALVQRARSGLDDSLVPALADRLATASHQHATAIGRILAEVAETQPDERAVPALLEALRTGRGAAAPLLLALGRQGGDAALVPILEHVGHADAGVQGAALDALDAYLARFGADGRAADPLLDALPNARGEARLRIVRLLGSLAEARALPALRPLLSHSDAALRRAVLRALGALGDPGSSDALFPLLTDTDAETRYEAAIALGHVMDATGVERVASELMSRAPRDRHALLTALTDGLLRVGTQVAAPRRAELATQLDALVDGRDRALAARAMHALSALATVEESAHERLRAHARRGHGALRYQALGALGELGSAASLAILREALGSGDARLAAAAASAMGRAGALRDLDASDTTRLIEALERPFPVPTAASYVLARLAVQRGATPARAGDDPATDPLRAALCGLLERREPHLRANVLVGLRALGHERCSSRLAVTALAQRPHQLPVRAAALLFVASAAQAPDAPRSATEEWSQVRARCLTNELTDALLDFCQRATPDLTPGPSRAVRTFAFAGDERTLLVNRWVVLRFADGSAFPAFTDLNGYLTLNAAPSGDVRLELPESVPLEP